MKILRRLTIALLPAAALLSIPAAGHASPELAPPPPEGNYIMNSSTISNLRLGIIHVKDGNYTHGTYDTLLNRLHRSNEYWSNTAGYYIGPGYCAQEWRLDNTGTFDYLRDVPAGQHFISTTQTYAIVAYRC